MIDEARAKKILSTVNDNLRNAVAVYAVHEKGASDGELLSKLNNSYAANAFNVVRVSLFYMVITSLSRAWDDAQDALSIPALRAYLSDHNAQASILDRRRRAMLGLESHPDMVKKYGSEPAIIAALARHSQEDADKAASSAQEEINRCLDLIKAANADPVTVRLKNFRHKIIAHSLEITRAEKSALAQGQTIGSLKYGDEGKLLKSTIPIVVLLNQVIDDFDIIFDNLQNNWRKYSDEFWNRVK